jgi:S-adenosyl-L-methionine hydrolase (adenosine-forming)
VIITFLSDYGLADEWVGVCHAVIAGIAPGARVIDLVHGIPRHDVRAGAVVLRNALGDLPVGVHLAVVDPQVGTERRAVAVRAADGRLFVGPDNGLLAPALERAGGPVEAVDAGRSPYRREPVSATFHGRDVFAPVAAHLAAGVELAAVGEPLGVAELAPLELPRPTVVPGAALLAHAVLIDRYGNVVLDAAHDDAAGAGLRLGRPVALMAPDGEFPAPYAATFADVAPGGLLLYEDANRALALAVNRGDASTRLGLSAGDPVRIRPEG